MPTMSVRAEDARETARLLADQAGVTTDIFVQPDDWPVGGVGNNRNARSALKWGIENLTGEPGFLFVEDDIIIKPERFKRAMEDAIDCDKLMYFYIHDVRPRTDAYPQEEWIKRMMGPDTRRGKPFSTDMTGLSVPEGPRTMRPGARMFGTQCVYFPMAIAEDFFEYMNQAYFYSAKIKTSKAAPVDTALINYYTTKRLEVLCYMPHPVQHTQNRKRRNPPRSDVYSKSFDLVSDLED